MRRQNLDRGLWATRTDRSNGVGKVSRPTVGEIVAIDRRHHDMVEAELGRCLGNAPRFIRIERTGKTGFDIAESAGARASVAHDHEGGVLFLPALADVWTARLFAHRVERVFAHKLLRREIASRDRWLDPNPVMLRQKGRIRFVLLFRVTG